MFRFRPTDHTYWYAERRIVGVTESLARPGVLDATHYDDAGTERGRRVHEWCAAYARHPDPRIRPLMDVGHCGAFMHCYETWRPVVHGIEQELYSPTLELAGRVDFIVELPDAWLPRGPGPLDLKTGEPEDWHPFQLALYAMLAEATYGPIAWGVNVYLADTGRWRPQFVEIDSRLRAQACAFLTTAQWLAAHR